MKTLEKLLQVREMITQLVICWSVHKDIYKIIAVDLSKQQALDSNQQINFTANLNRTAHTRIYFLLEEAKETRLDFSQITVKVL